jgi:hypothetical protein
MYVEIIGSDQSTTEFEFKNIVPGNPDPQLFSPAGYVIDNLLSSSAPAASDCTPDAPRAPIVMLSTSQHPGQTVATYVTPGYQGCFFQDASIVVGQSMSAIALSPRGTPIIQVLVADSGLHASNTVDFATLNLFMSDGSTASSLIIRVSIQ